MKTFKDLQESKQAERAVARLKKKYDKNSVKILVTKIGSEVPMLIHNIVTFSESALDPDRLKEKELMTRIEKDILKLKHLAGQFEEMIEDYKLDELSKALKKR